MNRRLPILSLVLSILAMASAQAQPAANGSMEMDPQRASVTVSFPGGRDRFGIVSGVIEYNSAQPALSTIAFSFDASSLNNKTLRDALAAENFPEIRVASTATKASGSNSATMTANITIKDVTRPVPLQVTYTPAAGGIVGFHAEGDIRRAGKIGGKDADLHVVIDAPFHRLAN